jgi:hypothetical protein
MRNTVRENSSRSPTKLAGCFARSSAAIDAWPRKEMVEVRNLCRECDSCLFFAYYNVGAGQPSAAFADLAHHYMKNELSEHADTVDSKAHTTIYIHRHILNDYLVPRWGKRP